MTIEEELEHKRRQVMELWDTIEHDILIDLANVWLDRDKLDKLEIKVEELESIVLSILQRLPQLKNLYQDSYKEEIKHLIRLIHHIKPKEQWAQAIQNDLEAISKATENIEEIIRKRRELRKQETLDIIKGQSKQLISKTGVPVQIVEFKHARYGNITILGIGEINTISKLNKEFDEATKEALQIIDNLREIIYEKALAHLKEVDPELYETYIDKTDLKLKELAKLRSTDGTILYQSASDIIDDFRVREKRNSQEGIKLQELERMVEDIRSSKIYSFASEVSGISDLPVGSIATLIYRKEEPKILIKRLSRVLHELRDELKYYGYYRRMNDELVRNRIIEVLKKLKNQKRVYYIIQIEVLKKYQNQKLTKALFDIAAWRIEYGKEPSEITYAIVMDSNRNRFLVIDVFKKYGYEEIHMSEISGAFGREGYTLLVKIKK